MDSVKRREGGGLGREKREGGLDRKGKVVVGLDTMQLWIWNCCPSNRQARASHAFILWLRFNSRRGMHNMEHTQSQAYATMRNASTHDKEKLQKRTCNYRIQHRAGRRLGLT